MRLEETPTMMTLDEIQDALQYQVFPVNGLDVTVECLDGGGVPRFRATIPGRRPVEAAGSVFQCVNEDGILVPDRRRFAEYAESLSR